MPTLLETLIEEGVATLELAKDSIPRQVRLPEAEGVIKVAIGMRRSGKSYLLYQVINRLIAQGILPEQVLFINFEDDRLLPMTAKEMGALIDSFYTLYPENHSRRSYLFLDEVQNVFGWEQVVRRFFDSKDTQLHITGSSSKLLSTEIATSLRGRSLSIEVWPYSFAEYLIAHKISMPAKPFGQKSFDVLRAHFLNYLNKGGFPGVQHLPENEWRETLQGYVETVIMRDIIERHNVTNIPLLKYLTKTLLMNAASPFSVNKFYNDIKSQGHKVSKDTIHHYLQYLEDAYLIFTVPLYSESIRAQHNIPKKVYAVDNGLINANALRVKDIYSKLLENQVYLDLRRQRKEVYFYNTRDGYEVDFVAVQKDGAREIIQVTWDMSDPETEKREKRALQQAEEELNIPGRIITLKDYLRDLVAAK